MCVRGFFPRYYARIKRFVTGPSNASARLLFSNVCRCLHGTHTQFSLWVNKSAPGPSVTDDIVSIKAHTRSIISMGHTNAAKVRYIYIYIASILHAYVYVCVCVFFIYVCVLKNVYIAYTYELCINDGRQVYTIYSDAFASVRRVRWNKIIQKLKTVRCVRAVYFVYTFRVCALCVLRYVRYRCCTSGRLFNVTCWV